MKIEIEISEADKEMFERANINIEKLIHTSVNGMIEGLKQVILAKNAGIPMDMTAILEYGRTLGSDAMKDAKGETTNGKV